MVRSRRRGFTLIELLTVMIVIGILAAILIPYFVRGRYMAEWSACTSNIHNMATALSQYATDNNSLYPTSLDVLTETTKNGMPYLVSIPTCPSNQTSYKNAYQPEDNNQGYTLYCPGVHYLILTDVRQGYPQYTTANGGQLTEK